MHTLEEDRTLIKSVQNYPIIYDKKNLHFKNPTVKMQAWAAIADDCGRTVDDCICRWKALRERYVKEKKLSKNERSEEGSCAPPHWALLNHFDFLSPHIAPRKTRTSFPSVPISEETEFLLESEEGSQGEVLLVEDGPPNFRFLQVLPPAAKRKADDASVGASSGTSSPSSLSAMVATEMPNKPTDTISIFASSIGTYAEEIMRRRPHRKTKIMLSAIELLKTYDNDD